MKIKKLIKTIIYIPIILIIFAIFYLFLILGESDDSSKGAFIHKSNTQQCRNLNLSNAQFDEIINEFGSAMLVKNNLPTRLELQCQGSKNNYLYKLDAEYSTEGGSNYLISAYSPNILINSPNLKSYTLQQKKNITIAGMQALWFESKNSIKICLNNENVNYIILLPKISDNEIITELNNLSLSK